MGSRMRQNSCAGAFHGEKSQIADTQIFRSGVSYVPETDTVGFKAGSNLRPVSVIDPRRDQR
jgi:hypothetical protein